MKIYCSRSDLNKALSNVSHSVPVRSTSNILEGILIEADDNKMIIEGGKLYGSEINGFNDHRIVMAFSIAALVSNGETTISDAHAINKTYPNFFEDYNRIGGKAIVINN